MPEIGVLITSAGTASAINVIRALRQQDEFKVRIVAVDVDPLAPGLRLADFSSIVPRVDDPNYIPSLLALGRQHGLEVVVPIFSREIALIAREAQRFRAAGLATLLSPPDVIEKCDNKEMSAHHARQIGLRVPHAYEPSTWTTLQPEIFPLFVKPAQGSSSRGAARVDGPADLKYLSGKYKNLLLQEFISGPEITVDVLCDASSQPLVIAPRSRLEVKGGQSTKCRTLSRDRFVEPVTRLTLSLGVRGACNVQFMEAGPELVFIELNPRFAAGGLMATVAAGANIPKLLLKLMLDLPINAEECSTKPGVCMSRYWTEFTWSE